MRLLNELADNPILKKVRGSSERDDEQVYLAPHLHAPTLQQADNCLVFAG